MQVAQPVGQTKKNTLKTNPLKIFYHSKRCYFHNIRLDMKKHIHYQMENSLLNRRNSFHRCYKLSNHTHKYRSFQWGHKDQDNWDKLSNYMKCNILPLKNRLIFIILNIKKASYVDRQKNSHRFQGDKCPCKSPPAETDRSDKKNIFFHLGTSSRLHLSPNNLKIQFFPRISYLLAQLAEQDTSMM